MRDNQQQLTAGEAALVEASRSRAGAAANDDNGASRQAAIDALKTANEGADIGAIKQAMEQLTAAQHTAAEELYKASEDATAVASATTSPMTPGSVGASRPWIRCTCARTCGIEEDTRAPRMSHAPIASSTDPPPARVPEAATAATATEPTTSGRR